MAAFVMLSAVLLGLLLPFSMADNNNNILYGDDTLNTGKFLTEGEFTFIMKSDCNLVFRPSHTTAPPFCWTNGNLVITVLMPTAYDIVIWASDTNGPEGKYILVLQRDGHVVIYAVGIYGPSLTNMKNRKKIAMEGSLKINKEIFLDDGHRAMVGSNEGFEASMDSNGKLFKKKKWTEEQLQKSETNDKDKMSE
ncbi:curculin-1-like [Curcuma longa]|uniref:curculin-1-like n=1 Tax=Curcuma longa TaxID=136217 RepID=UPI003D9F4550